MTAATKIVHVRMDERLKERAANALGAMELSVSNAVRVLLTYIAAEKRFPEGLKVPNAQTRTAMAEADEIFALRARGIVRVASRSKS